MRVCILDSGVELGHPQVGEVEQSWAVSLGAEGESIVEPDTAGDMCGHGTACAGIVRSLAPECELVSVRVLGEDYKGSGKVLMAGLRWAIEQGFDVVNMSLSTTKQDFAGLLHELADSAYFRRTTLVASAHNMPVESFPWRFSSVISVGSHEADDPFVYYYNPDPPVEFFGRGLEVDVAWLEGTTLRCTGNSFATPARVGSLRVDPVEAPGPCAVPAQERACPHREQRGRRLVSDDRFRAAVAAGVLDGRGAAPLAPPVDRRDRTRDLLAKASSIFLLDEAAGELVFEAVAGHGSDELVGRRFPAGTGIAGWVLTTRQPLVVEDVEGDPRFGREAAESTGYVPKRLMAVPMLNEDEALGVLSVLDRPTTSGSRWRRWSCWAASEPGGDRARAAAESASRARGAGGDGGARGARPHRRPPGPAPGRAPRRGASPAGRARRGAPSLSSTKGRRPTAPRPFGESR